MDKTSLYVKDPFESKYQLLINRIKKLGIKNFKKIFIKVFIDYSQVVDDENLKHYNLIKKIKAWIEFDNIIVDMEANKKSLLVNELFLRAIKLNISLVFISQYYFKVPKTITK